MKVHLQILLLSAIVASDWFTLTVSRGWSSHAPVSGDISRALGCTATKGSIAPCNPALVATAGTAANRLIVTITNRSSGTALGNISCSAGGYVTACVLSKASYSLGGGKSLADTVTYATAAINVSGSGTVRITTSGGIGSLSSTASVSISTLNACLPPDNVSNFLLSRMAAEATGSDQECPGWPSRLNIASAVVAIAGRSCDGWPALCESCFGLRFPRSYIPRKSTQSASDDLLVPVWHRLLPRQ